jgi:hypothetical protein
MPSEGPFSHELSPPRAILREGGRFGKGGRGAVRARLAKVLEVASKRPAVSNVFAASDSRLQHPRQHESFDRAALGHARVVAGQEIGVARRVVLE